MSYGTGSVGLNLQFTNYVFLFDRWWNPAVEDQAINRAHRLGQKETGVRDALRQPEHDRGPHRRGAGEEAAAVQGLIGQNGPPPSLGLTEDEIFGLFNVKARPKKAGSKL